MNCTRKKGKATMITTSCRVAMPDSGEMINRDPATAPMVQAHMMR